MFSILFYLLKASHCTFLDFQTINVKHIKIQNIREYKGTLLNTPESENAKIKILKVLELTHVTYTRLTGLSIVTEKRRVG